MPKSKLTIAKQISDETKERVMRRQHYKSISGVAITPYNVSFHHVIPRSSSGIGFEWNIVALTFDEHRWFHDESPIKVNSRVRYSNVEFQILMKNHLKLNYAGWREELCKYHKYWDEQDYINAMEGKGK